MPSKPMSTVSKPTTTPYLSPSTPPEPIPTLPAPINTDTTDTTVAARVIDLLDCPIPSPTVASLRLYSMPTSSPGPPGGRKTPTVRPDAKQATPM